MEHTEKVILAEFDNIDDMKPISRLTEEEMSRALDQRKLVLGWFDAIEEYVTERLESGKGFPGAQAVYTYTPTDHYGIDERGLVERDANVGPNAGHVERDGERDHAIRG